MLNFCSIVNVQDPRPVDRRTLIQSDTQTTVGRDVLHPTSVPPPSIRERKPLVKLEGRFRKRRDTLQYVWLLDCLLLRTRLTHSWLTADLVFETSSRKLWPRSSTLMNSLSSSLRSSSLFLLLQRLYNSTSPTSHHVFVFTFATRFPFAKVLGEERARDLFLKRQLKLAALGECRSITDACEKQQRFPTSFVPFLSSFLLLIPTSNSPSTSNFTPRTTTMPSLLESLADIIKGLYVLWHSLLVDVHWGLTSHSLPASNRFKGVFAIFETFFSLIKTFAEELITLASSTISFVFRNFFVLAAIAGVSLSDSFTHRQLILLFLSQ